MALRCKVLQTGFTFGYDAAGAVQIPGAGTNIANGHNLLGGSWAYKDCLSQHPEVTAVVRNGDMVAIGPCAAVTRKGLSAGKEISVIGFDDVSDASIAEPPLTTMAVSPYDLGRKLAKVVLDRMKDPDQPTSTTLAAAELVVRSTTGACQDNRA